MLDVASVRRSFPALQRMVHAKQAVYADGPGGTQVPQAVIDAMTGALRRGVSNLGGPFAASREATAITDAARAAVADLYNAPSPNDIVFGQNMTSLTLALGRALARTWDPGDEVVCTRLDHDANVSSWMQAALEAAAVVKLADFDTESGRLDPAAIAEVITDRTRLVAVTHASNAIGSIVDAAIVTQLAHDVGALVFVDAVHYAPHGSLDVQRIGCDFLAASAYKFYGPHIGALYGRTELLAEVDAVKIRPAPSEPPGKWESGTQSFESLAGVTAAVDYVASLGTGEHRRDRLVDAMRHISAHETLLSERFLQGIAAIDAITLYGPNGAAERTPTFAIDVSGVTPSEVARRLGAEGIFVWHGHYYALEVMQHLGVLDTGGLVRIGFVHYNTLDEVDRVLGVLAAIAGG